MHLLFSSCLTEWGGGEQWMLSAARGLSGRGHVVRLACRVGSELGRRARAADLPLDELSFRGDLDPVTSWHIWRICRRHRIELCCLNMDKVLRVAGPAARLAGAAVMPRRGSESPVGGKVSHKYAYLKVADGVIANSEATRDTMLASAPWLPPDKIRIIYNGIDCGRFADTSARARVRAAQGAGPDDPVIAMVGELTSRKNHFVVVERLAALRARFPGMQLWIVGEGPERATLADLAAEAGVGEALHLLGFRDDVPDLLQGSDLFCHPALREGFGYAIVEAMAAGKPVIAARASNIPEIVVDGETGLLVAPDDGTAWEAAIDGLLTAPDRAAALASAGRERAHARYSLARMLDETEAYFRECRKRRGERRG